MIPSVNVSKSKVVIINQPNNFWNIQGAASGFEAAGELIYLGSLITKEDAIVKDEKKVNNCGILYYEIDERVKYIS